MSRKAALLLTLTAALTGCSSTAGGDAACPAPVPAPTEETALLPDGLSFDQIGTVTSVRSDDRHISLQAVSDKHIDEVTVLIQDAVIAAGYRPAGMDNEGFEAEVFFTAGAYAAGQAVVRRSGCPDRWDIELVLITTEAIPPQSSPPPAP
ncbi:hypothetical protein ACFPM7_29770 [Actinokineospora guangxiensis]|uniref:Lipoprotein n=1 Tax=Actinokineospora guangxiensis TaxID=1490288 RepID=A0ABW0EXQ7_9PSEU